MARLHDLVRYCDERLDTATFDDYCPNGLQVEAGDEVSRIVSGVTASLAQIEAAAEAGADLLLVHHGYFWKGEAAPLTGMKGRRVRQLMQAGISLLAYHLPLDAHPELGNNAGLGHALGLDGEPLAPQSLVWGGELGQACLGDEFAAHIGEKLQREPLVLNADRPIRKVAWCTGAAQGYISQAADAGYDAFVSGEVSEQTLHLARELDIAYFAAGHHATERFGVMSLGAELEQRFGLSHRFVDLDNPV
jgi:dinuclear metal center YbgI/SA1388 family protein